MGIVAVLAAAAVLYLLPGLALLRLLWPSCPLTSTEQWALAGAIGASLPPLILELCHLVGLPWNTGAVILYLLMAIGIVTWPIVRSTTNSEALRFPRLHVHPLIVGGVALAAMIIRVYLVRGLDVGMWGDSYHHTMITQLLVDHGGLFTSWQPYAPLSTFTYHFGFHANAAFLHWLIGIPVTQSVVMTGQIMNGLTVPLAYVLATRWSGSQSCGVWTAVLTGFVNIEPTFYVNYGRFTQLSGQVILPALLVCMAATLEAPRRHWRLVLLTGLVSAGLLLTHYIVSIIAFIWTGAYIVMLIVRSRHPRSWLKVAVTVWLISVVACLLAAPWLLNTLSGYLSRNVAVFLQPASVIQSRTAVTNTFGSLTPLYIKSPLILLAGLGLLIALARRNWHMTLLAVWSGLLLLAAVPDRIGLPGTGVITFFTAAIALYIPLLPLAAYTLASIEEIVARRLPRPAVALNTVAIVGCVAWGGWWQRNLLDPYYQLFTPADAIAMRWITQHTDRNALFLVNMFPAFGGTLVAGDDGGWWIPLLTGRPTTLPPITYGSERSVDPAFAQNTNSFVAALHRTPLPAAQGIALCRSRGIRYIYSGPHHGQDDYRIDTAALRQNPAFRTLYDHAGVVIFELKDPS
ncbi:MAG: hypothetical protein NVSMB42_05660 [Herpetosiphon sp.]